MIRLVFLVLASLGLMTALGTVLSRNLVRAALHLVAFFFVVACLFVLLEAEFIAIVQVLVYIGAVAILMMFGIMLSREVQGDETTDGRWTRLAPAAIVAVGFLAAMAFGIGREKGLGVRPPWSVMVSRAAIGSDPALKASPRGRAINDMGRTLGDELMSRYALPFEVVGLLLTAAAVGSIALARQEGEGDDGPAERAGLARRTPTPTRRVVEPVLPAANGDGGTP